jgi:hypothetical protein
MRVASLKVNVPVCILCALAVSGCATTPGKATYGDRVSFHMQCRNEVGPEPHEAAGWFGAVGAVVKVSQPEWKEWSAKVEDCTKRKVAELEGTATSGAKGKQSAKQ